MALVSTKTYVQKHFVLKTQVSSSLSLFAWCCSLGMSALEVKATTPSSWMSVVANPLSDTSTWIVNNNNNNNNCLFPICLQMSCFNHLHFLIPVSENGMSQNLAVIF